MPKNHAGAPVPTFRPRGDAYRRPRRWHARPRAGAGDVPEPGAAHRGPAGHRNAVRRRSAPPTQLVHDAVVGMLDDLDGESELIEPLRTPHDRGTEADVGLVTI